MNTPDQILGSKIAVTSTAAKVTAPSTNPDPSSKTDSLFRAWSSAWNQFWFRSEDPTILALIRIFTGSVVVYAHLVWSSELLTFFGDDGVLPSGYRHLLFGRSDFAWSHFDVVHSATAIWAIHWIGLIILGLFTVGVGTRATAVLSALLVISYANRATGALFGLDQIMGFLCLYLAVGNSGGALSIDRWLAKRRQRRTSSAGQGRGVDFSLTGIKRDVSTNIAIRLIQIHMCIVYLFAGLGKLQGETWWNGQAIWYSLASYEYQTLDMTWMANHMWLVSLITLFTVAWEVSYVALIWPRLTRPFMLLFAIPIHLAIGLGMGMMTFGLIMLIGNLAFVSPERIGRWTNWRPDSVG